MDKKELEEIFGTKATVVNLADLSDPISEAFFEINEDMEQHLQKNRVLRNESLKQALQAYLTD